MPYDPGPPPAIEAHLAAMPSYAAHRELFWYDWGPVFYRGRLDGSAKVLGIGSDPGPTERIVGRTLVGDAGQRVQGFLGRLGLSSGYVLVNAYSYALHPSCTFEALPFLADPDQAQWRNTLLGLISGPSLQAIVAFGMNAAAVLDQWDHPAVPAIKVPHPSNPNTTELLDAWRSAIEQLRDVVTPDGGGDATGPNYGTTFEEGDYTRIPALDLPFGLPDWVGDDAWGRTDTPRHNNSVERPATDPDHTLVWRAPANQP